MKEFKGYPGPWSMRIKDRMAIFDFNHNGETKHWRFAECVVSMATDDETQDYLMANANLIYAAPEMLQALQNMVESYQYEASHDNPALLQARAAIAKALGESK
ncbi:hypothetical protein RDJ50_004541 [Salmonella enterica]|nr:hypothetical protein [Salmonella enterica]